MWVLVRFPLPPPAVQWERGGVGSASGGASDLATSSLLGVGVVGSSRSKESLVLANSSGSLLCLCRT